MNFWIGFFVIACGITIWAWEPRQPQQLDGFRHHHVFIGEPKVIKDGTTTTITYHGTMWAPALITPDTTPEQAPK